MIALPPCSATYSLRQDQHAARARAGVVDAHPFLGLDQPHHHPDDRARRVELAALLAGRVRELADEVLVRGSEQVGELEVLVAQSNLVEVVDQLAQALVGDLRLAHDASEVDVGEHAFEGRVDLFHRAQRLVQARPDVLVELVADVRPPGLRRHEEGVAVEVGHLGPLLGLLRGAAESQLLRDDGGTPNLELVRAPLQEQHPEDVLLELGGIHLAAQDVGGTEQMSLQLCEGQLPMGREH